MTAVAALAARGADSLLAEFASGSGPGAGEAAFAEVVRRYAAAVFATCLRVTKNAHDADDATQVTFLTLALQAKAGKPIAKLAPWLQRVAQRAALDVRRGHSARPPQTPAIMRWRRERTRAWRWGMNWAPGVAVRGILSRPRKNFGQHGGRGT